MLQPAFGDAAVGVVIVIVVAWTRLWRLFASATALAMAQNEAFAVRQRVIEALSERYQVGRVGDEVHFVDLPGEQAFEYGAQVVLCAAA